LPPYARIVADISRLPLSEKAYRESSYLTSMS
jgi:hypothetical protein